MACANCADSVLRAFIHSFADPLILQSTIKCQLFCRSTRERRFISTAIRLRSVHVASTIGNDGNFIPFAECPSKKVQSHRSVARRAAQNTPLSGGARDHLRTSGNRYKDSEPLRNGSQSTENREISPGFGEGSERENVSPERLENSIVQSPSSGPLAQDSSRPERHMRRTTQKQRNETQVARDYIGLGLRKNNVKPNSIPQIQKGLQRPREQWQVQKKALSSKFGFPGWQPRKRLSPDALDGIRSLHAQDPEKYSTPALADQFKISPEAIRRILKSKWRPNDDEEDDRRLRWERRGQNIWSQMSQLGIKPPKKWRSLGVQNAVSDRWGGPNRVTVDDDTKPEYIPLADRIR